MGAGGRRKRVDDGRTPRPALDRAGRFFLPALGRNTMPDGYGTHSVHTRARGLDPWREHDACGVGFVAQASGQRSADVTRLALQALAHVAHRGAAATDRSGDGAGVLTQIPLSLFYREAASRGLALERGQPFAVGAFFLPRSDDA